MECKNLPSGSHPDCTIQLTHAAIELRKPFAMDPKLTITPLTTKFAHTHHELL